VKSIRFNDEAIDTYIWALNKLALMTVDIDVTNDGYPHERVVIKRAEEDGLVICESDETGKPISNATWMIPYEVIQSITIL
jgi:hypothetical protein